MPRRLVATFANLPSLCTSAMLRSMTKVVKTFLMWMMLFALPLQGMAQASMFACHLKGDSTAAVQMKGHGSMDHHASMNQSGMHHGGMDHSMHSMSDMGGTNADGSFDPDSSKKLMKSLHGCCNCAPTCAVVLLPMVQASFATIQQETSHPISYSQLPHSADTRRIERPPKTLAI